METDPALHHHLASGYRALQPSLHTHQSQHHVQQHNVHHHPHQHSPHQGYAPHNGLDLSSLVNVEDDYQHDLQRLQHAQYQQHQHGHAQSPFERQGHMLHEGAHTPVNSHQHEHLQAHHTEHHHPDHHLAQNVLQPHEQREQHTQHTHPSLRPYSLMHQSGEHGALQMQQEDVFGSQTPMGGVHVQTQGDAHLVSAPGTQLGDDKLTVNLGGDGEKKFRVVPNPPDLEAWRQKLFDVDEMITLSEEEYYTYFPHVDNVYSHRSTQKYKRKPFVSHYWDCRLKGRPPGTKKSDDPEKKKRKRMARERDLCDVKIKITEFFEGGENARMQQVPDEQMVEGDGQQGHGQENGEGEANGYYASHTPQPPSHTNPNLDPSFQPPQPRPPGPSPPPPQHPHNSVRTAHPDAPGARYFTIQRVNGNGGNGKGDGVAGPHKHSLEDSDRIKKNSVIRSTLKESRELKRASGTLGRGGSVSGGGCGVKKGVSRATGQAALTIKRHSKAVKDDGVTLFGDITDISTQRVWIALEIWKIPYQFVESEKKGSIDERLRDVCPRPETVKLPRLRKGTWGVCGERAVLEYLNEVAERQCAHSPLANPGLATKFSGVAAGKRAGSRPGPDNSPPASAAAPAEKIDWAGAVASVAPAFDTLAVHPSATAHTSLLPPDPRDRAYARQWAAFVDEEILPAYNDYLSDSSPAADAHSNISSTSGQGSRQGTRKGGMIGLEGQGKEGLEGKVPAHIYEALQNSIIHLVGAAHPIGPFFAGPAMSYVDVVFAPIVVRIGMLLVEKKGWRAPQPGTRWESWVKAIEGDERVRATCCEAGTYEAAWESARERARRKTTGGGADVKEQGERI